MRIKDFILKGIEVGFLGACLTVGVVVVTLGLMRFGVLGDQSWRMLLAALPGEQLGDKVLPDQDKVIEFDQRTKESLYANVIGAVVYESSKEYAACQLMKEQGKGNCDLEKIENRAKERVELTVGLHAKAARLLAITGMEIYRETEPLFRSSPGVAPNKTIENRPLTQKEKAERDGVLKWLQERDTAND